MAINRLFEFFLGMYFVPSVSPYFVVIIYSNYIIIIILVMDYLYLQEQTAEVLGK